MRVLLVKPNNLSDHIQPSLGLAYLAQGIRSRHEVRILDCIKDGLSPAEFAEKSLERFANPFLDHQLADIALHREDKVKVRLEPSYQAFVSKFGEKPPILGELLGR